MPWWSAAHVATAMHKKYDWHFLFCLQICCFIRKMPKWLFTRLVFLILIRLFRISINNLLGVYTFKNRQSSSPQNWEKLNVVCKHFEPYCVAFRMPIHGSIGCGTFDYHSTGEKTQFTIYNLLSQWNLLMNDLWWKQVNDHILNQTSHDHSNDQIITFSAKKNVRCRDVLTRNRSGPIGGFAYGIPWNE